MSPLINGNLRGWIQLILAFVVLVASGIVYVHTNFTSVEQHNRDQDRIEHQLENIQKDVSEILRRTK